MRVNFSIFGHVVGRTKVEIELRLFFLLRPIGTQALEVTGSPMVRKNATMSRLGYIAIVRQELKRAPV